MPQTQEQNGSAPILSVSGLNLHYGEAQALTVSGQPAYLMQSLAWWTLDWKLGNDGFELRAPISAISAGGLLAVAASVHS